MYQFTNNWPAGDTFLCVHFGVPRFWHYAWDLLSSLNFMKWSRYLLFNGIINLKIEIDFWQTVILATWLPIQLVYRCQYISVTAVTELIICVLFQSFFLATASSSLQFTTPLLASEHFWLQDLRCGTACHRRLPRHRLWRDVFVHWVISWHLAHLTFFVATHCL